jgi:hypothetical protein
VTTAAQKMARSSKGAVTGVDQRPIGRGVIVVHFEGRTEEGKEMGHDIIGRRPF